MKKKILIAIPILILLFILVLQPSKKIEWHEENSYRWSELDIPWFGKSGFEKLSEEKTGLDFVNILQEHQFKNNRVLLNGSGLAIGDIDDDGLVDIYFCRLDGNNVLYRNLGDLKFQDITEESGVACPEQFSSAAVFADIDGDDDLDLLVTAIGGPNACFLNDGTGKFTDVSESAGIVAKTGAGSMALADIDGDGDLDLYIANYKRIRAKDIYTPFELGFKNIVQRVNDIYQIAPKFQEHYTLEIRGTQILWLEKGEPDMLLLNDGKGTFAQAPQNSFLDETGAPISELHDWGLMVRFQDIDDDNDPDIYVCNDFDTPDRIWINKGDGRFQAIPQFAIRKTSNSSMAVDFSDIDRDGDLDFFVVDMLSRDHQKRMTQFQTMAPQINKIGEFKNRPEYMRNTLFMNRGDNTYSEIAQFGGIEASEWSWSVQFLDVDLDGYEDILIPTGNLYDSQDLDTAERINRRMRSGLLNAKDVISMYPKLNLPNVAFRNRGNLTFEDVSTEWGFNEVDISQGMALGDLDNDGDLDVVINRLGKPAVIYRNRTTAPRVAVRLKGLAPNTRAIGAKIKLLGAPIQQIKEVVCGGAYLSHSDPLYSFAAPESDSLKIVVTWRKGTTTIIKNVKPNHIYEIQESNTNRTDAISAADGIDRQSAKPFFEDVSHLLNHFHHEEPFDDFRRQPLLPNRLSQLGPGVAWYDFDNDGDDDLAISSGRGGQLTVFENDKSTFKRIQHPQFKISELDQTTVLGWTQSHTTSILVGHSNFENSEQRDSFVTQYDFNNGKLSTTNQFNVNSASIGPMALADYDGDNDLDLFVGSRTIPGRYPEPGASVLFKNENGEFKQDEKNTAILTSIGMVSGAVFSDLDADGDADLVLALEWGPVTVLRNDGGLYKNITEALGLSKYSGLWNGVTTGDFNGDGRLDIIATNWGHNSKYSKTQPLCLYYYDFDNNGILDIIESYWNFKMQAEVPIHSLNHLETGLPFVRMRTSTHRKYSVSSVSQIMGPKLDQAGKLEVNTLSHMLFINRGARFEAMPLPDEAQFAVSFYVGVADFNGDGHDDVFLTQNFFGTNMATPRSDAGRGLWLKGNGAGEFKSMPGQETGIKIYGEQRGAALGDYDGDGRVDLVVTQNGSATKLYRNTGAKPGLRVRLIGPNGNPLGIGASIRMIYKNGFGPAREIHAGSGYWSQDSAVQIMGLRENPVGIWVRWPGGNITNSDLPKKAREITIDWKGNIAVLD